MKLYSLPLSPFAARIRLSIYRKGLNIDIVPPPEGGLKSDAFLTLNPMGQLPTLVLDSGFAIPESATILEYLEDVFPTPSLRPTNAQDLSRARLFLRLPDIYFQNSPRTLLNMRNPANRNEEVVKTQLEILNKGLSYIDHYLDGEAWAVGGQASIADCALVPVLNVVNLIALVYNQPDLLGKYRKLSAYWEAAKADEINAKVIAEQMAALPKT